MWFPQCITSAVRSHQEATEGTGDVKEAICTGVCPAETYKGAISSHQRVPNFKPKNPPRLQQAHKANGSHDHSSSLGVIEKEAGSSFQGILG